MQLLLLQQIQLVQLGRHEQREVTQYRNEQGGQVTYKTVDQQEYDHSIDI